MIRVARYITIGVTFGASAWAGLALLDSELFWQLKLIIAAVLLSPVAVAWMWFQNWWAEAPLREARHGKQTEAEFTAFDAAWLDEMQVEL